MDGEDWWATVHGVTKSQTGLSLSWLITFGSSSNTALFSVAKVRNIA